jgi:hypothetical protein
VREGDRDARQGDDTERRRLFGRFRTLPRRFHDKNLATRDLVVPAARRDEHADGVAADGAHGDAVHAALVRAPCDVAWPDRAY